MKKHVLISAFLWLFVWSVFAGDFGVRIMPAFNLFTDSKLDNPFGVSAGIDYSPVTLRGRDDIYLGLQGTFFNLSAKGIKPISFLDGSFALGYNYRALDQLTIGLEGLVGLWSVPKSEENKLEGASGVSYGGRLSAYYNLFPELSVGGFAAYRSFSGGTKSFIDDIEVGLSVKYSFTKGLFGSSDIAVEDCEVQTLFPIFYSRYSDNGFGRMTFVNNEKNDITDVEVSVYIEKYMTNPDVCTKIPRVKRGDSFDAELTCFLTESMLTNLVAEKADAIITVNYKSLGKRVSYTQSLELQALSRNSMTWEDDRRAAAFVSPRDGTANYFANYVKNAVRNSLKPGIPENIQYAAAMFAALKAFGINYVIDPASAFTDNIGTTQIDFLQFPYQTLLYSGGDCDDLSILNCSLFEAIGIDTAFVTCPGHIFIAFDAGVPVDQASKAGDCIIIEDKVWIPLEVTLSQDTFTLERTTAMREWKKYPDTRALIPLKEAWKEYKPVGIPDSSVIINLPSKTTIINGFKNSL